jgi:hypothetical protein
VFYMKSWMGWCTRYVARRRHRKAYKTVVGGEHPGKSPHGRLRRGNIKRDPSESEFRMECGCSSLRIMSNGRHWY